MALVAVENAFVFLVLVAAFFTFDCVNATSIRRYHLHERGSVVAEDPLSGTSCDAFITMYSEWKGGANGKIDFNVPQGADRWSIEVML